MRAVNRIAAGLLGLALLVVGLVAAAEVALVLAGHPPWPGWLATWLNRWTTTTVGDSRVFWISIGAAVLGLLVLLSQLRRWRPDRLPAGDEEQGVWWLSRRGVERRAAASAGALVGVHDAHAAVRGGPHSWRVRLTAEAKPEDRETVTRTVRHELDRMSLPAGVPVEVTIRPPKRVA